MHGDAAKITACAHDPLSAKLREVAEGWAEPEASLYDDAEEEDDSDVDEAAEAAAAAKEAKARVYHRNGVCPGNGDESDHEDDSGEDVDADDEDDDEGDEGDADEDDADDHTARATFVFFSNTQQDSHAYSCCAKYANAVALNTSVVYDHTTTVIFGGDSADPLHGPAVGRWVRWVNNDEGREKESGAEQDANA